MASEDAAERAGSEPMKKAAGVGKAVRDDVDGVREGWPNKGPPSIALPKNR